MGDTILERSHAGFRTTSWTLIGAVRDRAHPDHDRAIDTLVRRYWPAVYAQYRRTGRGREEAEELTQGFFVHVVIGRRLFEHADAGRGLLRTLIHTALKNYARDVYRPTRPWDPSRRIDLDGLEREETFLSREGAAGPDEAFESRWAMAVVEEAMERCRHYFHSLAKEKHWEAFRTAVIQPAVSGGESPPLSLVAEDLGFPSPTHVASALKVVRKRMRILLREVAAETADDPHDQDAEYHRLRERLG